MRHIKNICDREDCQQEIFVELYTFMPLSEDDAIRLVNQVSRRFKYREKQLNEKEIGLDEAGIE